MRSEKASVFQASVFDSLNGEVCDVASDMIIVPVFVLLKVLALLLRPSFVSFAYHSCNFIKYFL